MVRIYERLAGMSACLAMLAALAGLAAVPQTASAVVPIIIPPCTGTCTVNCSVVTNSCSILAVNNCSAACTVCSGTQTNVNGICTSCVPASCN
jgi:hypothetical protein